MTKMEIRNLKPGDRFIKWDGKYCELISLNDMRAYIKVYGLTKKVEIDIFGTKAEKKYSGEDSVSPGTEIIRVLDSSEVIPTSRQKDQPRKEPQQPTKGDRIMAREKNNRRMTDEDVAKFIDEILKGNSEMSPTQGMEKFRVKHSGRFDWKTFKTLFVKASGWDRAKRTKQVATKKANRGGKKAKTKKAIPRVTGKATTKAKKVKVLSAKEAKAVEKQIKKESGDKPARSLSNGALPFSKEKQLGKKKKSLTELAQKLS